MCGIYACIICVIHCITGVLHMYNMCMNYMCNTLKIPDMYYICMNTCGTFGSVLFSTQLQVKRQKEISICVFADQNCCKTKQVPLDNQLVSTWNRILLNMHQLHEIGISTYDHTPSPSLLHITLLLHIWFISF